MHNCLLVNKQGGAATVTGESPSFNQHKANHSLSPATDSHNAPILSIFLWANGASFENVMANYMSAAWPVGIDPTDPGSLRFVNGTVPSFENMGNGTSIPIP